MEKRLEIPCLLPYVTNDTLDTSTALCR